MGQLVCSGALLKCSFGAAPCSLNVLPANRVMSSAPVANVMDCKPGANITPFGMCSAPSNPAVIAAQGAPAPCTPNIASPQWLPGSPTVLVANFSALNDSSKLMCAFGGVIEVTMPGQMTVKAP